MSDSLIPERTDYGSHPLLRSELSSEPLDFFKTWLSEAVSQGVPEANAVCLCTLGENEYPDGRMVLIKEVSPQGLIFYTNYESRKGRQLAQVPKASMIFWWEPLKRQVRLTGTVKQISSEHSDAYFASRPRESQLGAWASDQSRRLSERDDLSESLREAGERFPKTVPRPPHWGGLVLIPHRVEFWQGRTSRLHDRFCYQRHRGGEWEVERLMP